MPVLVCGDPATSLSFHDALLDHGLHIDWLFEGFSFQTQEAKVENVWGVFCSPVCWPRLVVFPFSLFTLEGEHEVGMEDTHFDPHGDALVEKLSDSAAILLVCCVRDSQNVFNYDGGVFFAEWRVLHLAALGKHDAVHELHNAHTAGGDAFPLQ